MSLVLSMHEAAKTLTDEEAVSHMADGDRHAFAEFYDRHAGRVLGFLVRFVQSRPLAEDALQETFWHVWTRASQFDQNRGAATAWLLRIARTRGIDLLRSRNTKCDMREEQAESQPQPEPCALEKMELAGEVRKVLARLPEEQRNAISLAFFCGYTHEQIARDQRIPLGSAKTRIRRGMQRMKVMLDDPERKAI